MMFVVLAKRTRGDSMDKLTREQVRGAIMDVTVTAKGYLGIEKVGEGPQAHLIIKEEGRDESGKPTGIIEVTEMTDETGLQEGLGLESIDIADLSAKLDTMLEGKLEEAEKAAAKANDEVRFTSVNAVCGFLEKYGLLEK